MQPPKYSVQEQSNKGFIVTVEEVVVELLSPNFPRVVWATRTLLSLRAEQIEMIEIVWCFGAAFIDGVTSGS